MPRRDENAFFEMVHEADRRDVSARSRRVRDARIRERLLHHRHHTAGGARPGARGASLPPMRVIESGAFIVHPAGPSLLRAALAALPSEASAGLGAIELRAGGDVLAAHARPNHRPDPFTGRPGQEILPGVWGAPLRGLYRPDSRTVSLFAYVCDPRRPLRVFDIYLKLRALSTFAHELAHHLDGREHLRGLDAPDPEVHLADLLSEEAAEAQQFQWVHAVIGPLLRQRYPAEVDRLERWILYRGGASVRLEQLARVEEPHPVGGAADLRARLVRGLFPLADAVEALARDAADGQPVARTRLGFARRLLLGGWRHLALDAARAAREATGERSRGALLAAREVEARALVELGQLDAAARAARSLIDAAGPGAPEHARAWGVLARVHRARGGWRDLLDATSRIIELGARERLPGAFEQRVRARLELGELAGIEGDLDALYARGDRWHRLRSLGLRAIALLRRGQLEEALDFASRALPAPGDGVRAWQHELIAVRYDAARRLGRAAEPPPPSTLEALRDRGYQAWARSLERPLEA